MKKIIISIALAVLMSVFVMALSACNFDWLNNLPNYEEPAQSTSVSTGNGLINGGMYSAH